MWALLATTIALVVAPTLAAVTPGSGAPSSSGATGALKALVSYCPTDFSGAAAVITIDPTSGAYTLDGTFTWPKSLVEGCVADYDPIVEYDSATGLLWLDFTEDLGVLASVSLADVKLESIVHVKDAFWTGFESFDAATPSSFIGISGTVTQKGLCNDGCMQIGTVGTDGSYQAAANILFKETADDVHLFDAATNVYYGQFGYQLDTPRCAPVASDLCLLAIDATTGAVNSAVYTPFDVYAFGSTGIDAAGNVTAWMEGFDSVCKNRENDFAFGTLNLATGAATPLACIAHNTTVDMDEWIGSFSLDDSLFATGSGNAYGDPAQMLVFDVAQGATLSNTELSGLAKQLKAAQGLIFVWAVQFV